MGATRDVALNELPVRGISINPASTGTAAITVVASDSGVCFVNKYASATTYTLPTVADAAGKWFWFFNVGAGGIVLTGGSTDVMVGINAAEADTATFSTGSQMIGAAALVMCDGTNYLVFNLGNCTMTMGG